MSTLQALLELARQQVEEISPEDLLARQHLTTAPLVLDVREHPELIDGIIRGALHIPRGELELRADVILEQPERPIIVYCAAGTRSLLAAKTLRDLGIEQVSSLRGGFKGWQARGLPVTIPEESGTLSQAERRRYARHISIPEIGEEGQRALLQARVLLIGAGGLGSPAALYLAAAGVGTLGIVDFDIVEVSNLQRQILHRDAGVGERKTASASQTLQALNPDVHVERFDVALSAENAEDIFQRNWDVVVDGSDNFATRYLINDVARLLRLPVVHGSIARFTGQLLTVLPGEGPCYRCVYGEEPDAGSAPTCQEAGVLGVLPGVIGTLQATEALKILLKQGRLLAGSMLLFDALEMRFRELQTARDPQCSACRLLS